MARFSSRALGACVIGIFVHLDARAAGAEEPRVRRLTYDAPPGCPSREVFEDQVQSRTPQAWLPTADERTFEVHIAEDGEGEFLGRLELGGDAPSHREIRGPTCDGVVSSLALFLSIALATEPPPEPTHAPPPEEPGPPESPRTERPSTPSKREPARGATSTTTRDASRTVPYWEWDAGFQGVLILTGNVASGGRVYGELVRGFGAVSPSLRVSAGWSDFSVHPARAGTAELRRRTVRAEPCLRMRAIGRVTLSPCVGFEAGPFDVATPDLPRSAKTSTRWLAATGTLRGSLTLSSWISLEASASLLAPLERPAFALVEPFRPIYRAPPVLFELGAGVTLNARFF